MKLSDYFKYEIVALSDENGNCLPKPKTILYTDKIPTNISKPSAKIEDNCREYIVDHSRYPLIVFMNKLCYVFYNLE